MVRWLTISVVSVVSVVLAIGSWVGTIHMPDPPAALTDSFSEYFVHILEPLYWLFFIASATGYFILLWQKHNTETFPATSLRWLTLAKAVLWFSLCVSRIWGEWRVIIWSLTATYAGIMAIVWVASLYFGYVRPARQTREHAPPIEGTTLPPRNDLCSTL